MTVKEKLAEHSDFVDVGILYHGFAPHMRDYDVVFEAMWGRKKWGDNKGTYRLRFAYCPEATTVTSVSDEFWKEAWSDVFIDQAQWLAAGEPHGFCWWACWSNIFPGVSYVEDSPRARHWTERLGKQMHEVIVETEAFRLSVVFHDLTVTKLSAQVQVVDKTMLPMDRQSDGAPGKDTDRL